MVSKTIITFSSRVDGVTNRLYKIREPALLTKRVTMLIILTGVEKGRWGWGTRGLRWGMRWWGWG